MGTPSIGAAMIAIRDMRAPWIENRHWSVLTALAMRLPIIRPSGAQIAADARLHRSTVCETLPELRERGLIAYESKPGVATVYHLRMANIERLRPLEPEPVPLADTPSDLSPWPTGQSSTCPPGRQVPVPLADTTCPPGRHEESRESTEEPIRDPTRTPATRPPDQNPAARAWQHDNPKPVARRQGEDVTRGNGKPPLPRKQPAGTRRGPATGSTTLEPPPRQLDLPDPATRLLAPADGDPCEAAAG